MADRISELEKLSYDETKALIETLKEQLKAKKPERKPSAFARNLRYLRMKCGLKLDDVAELANAVNGSKQNRLMRVERSDLQGWENGRDVPPKYKDGICKALGVDLDLMEKDWFDIVRGEKNG